MKKSPVATAAMVGLVGLICLVTILILVYRHGRVVLARERAEAALPLAVREMKAGKDVVEVPVWPNFIERSFASGQLEGWTEVDADMIEIPKFSRPEKFLYYDVREVGAAKPIFEGPFNHTSGNSRGNIVCPGNVAIKIKVSRDPSCKPVYLKMAVNFRPSAYGYYGGPWQNKRP